jgi:N-acetylmuramic acid 6-phosphate etherase
LPREFLDEIDGYRKTPGMNPEAFLKISDQFRLGELVTEQPHPETTNLAELAQRSLPEAIDAFHAVDCSALDRLMDCLGPLPELVDSIRDTLSGGGRIFIAGCGATGRLALSLEVFAREAWLSPEEPDRVVSFMAGGDAALIKSIEAFEDYPAYGERQLLECGFTKEDLLLAITEGGETPWVIGACLKASQMATRKPWFFFCNPPDLLKRLTERSREVLQCPAVRPFFLDTGPMALAGSTRLQATTVQMLVAGAALAEAFGHGEAAALIEEFKTLLTSRGPGWLAPFIEAEARIYQRGDLVLYETDRYGVTVLTDTTERSPTFSLVPFERRLHPEDPMSWCYLSLPGAPDSETAWEILLRRPPRTLEWADLDGVASLKHLMGHDISSRAQDWRSGRHAGRKQYPYLVHGAGVILEFAGLSHSLDLKDRPLLLKHLLIKTCLNLQSTLVMGRLGLFESNLMTRVKPSNYKLIDRAARHTQHHHLQKTGRKLDYASAVREVFRKLKK